MSDSDEDIDVVTPANDDDDVVVINYDEVLRSMAATSEASVSEDSDKEEEAVPSEGHLSANEADEDEKWVVSGEEEALEEPVDRQTTPENSQTSSSSASPPKARIFHPQNYGPRGALAPYGRLSRLPNILSRQVRKRKFVGTPAPYERKVKETPEVKERVLEILKNAQEAIKEKHEEVIRRPIAYPKYHLPARNINLNAIRTDPKDPFGLENSLRQLTRVEFGKKDENKCFVISDKLKRLIVDFKQATSHIDGPAIGLKPCHMDLLVAIDSQLNFECHHTREKQYIIKHLSDHVGVYPLALMNRIARRRQELREESSFLSHVMSASSVNSIDPSIPQKPEAKEEKRMSIAEMQRMASEKRNAQDSKKNMAILVPRPKYLVYKPRVFKLDPSSGRKDTPTRLRELSSKKEVVKTATGFVKKEESMEEEEETIPIEGPEEDSKNEKPAADFTLPQAEPSTVSPSLNIPRVITRVSPIFVRGNKAPYTPPQLISRKSVHMQPLPGSLAASMTTVQHMAVTSIKDRIDELRAERTKILTDHGRVMDKMNQIEQNAIPAFLARMNYSSRASAVDGHQTKVNLYKGLKLQRQNLVDKIGKINDDIDNLLSASVSSV